MSGGTLAFFILAAFGLGGVTTMLTARRVIHMVLALSLSFLAIAGLYVLLGADFLGVVQIIVYTGAITILAVFGIMLTPHGGLETEPKSAPRQGRRMPLVAFLLAAGLFAVLFWAVAGTRFARSPFASDEPVDAAAIGGLLLSSRYLLPFEVISVVLLVALIGAIVLAKDDASDTAGSVQAEEHAGTSPAEPPTVRADNAEAHRADRTAASARDTGESGQHVEKEAQLVGAVREANRE
ncbi:MAG: NADH-quinone oxidoreductase subunit J [Hydrogenibacillus sp.]|nr:NADH-quinone oxidoreductase subunit J [Hydrogenibacillus sp.]